MRTKVLFAFGTHDGRTPGGKVIPAHERFFRNSVQPVLTETFLRRKNAAVIFEIVFFPDANTPSREDIEAFQRRDLSEIENKIRAAEAELKKSEEQVRSAWAERLDTGKQLFYPVRWGFERRMLMINLLRPGTIRSIPEPQVVEAMWQHHLEEMLQDKIGKATKDEAVDLMMEIMKAHYTHIILRDAAVYGLVKKLREENPSRSIIIPRGSGHRGMPSLLPESEFETRVFCDIGFIDFKTEATVKSYRGELSRQELADYARLQLDYDRYHLVRMFSPLHMALMVGGIRIHEVFQNISDSFLVPESRKFAIAANPDCAERLGIKV